MSARILQVTDSIGVGGPARVCAPLSSELQRRGHTMRVFSLSVPPATVRDAWERSEPRVATDYVDAGSSRLRPLRQLTRVLRDFTPDLVHVHGYLGLFYLAALRCRVPLVAHVHGHVTNRHWRKLLIVWLYRQALRRARAVVAVSEATARWLEEQGLPRSKVTVVRNACEPPAALPERSASRARWGLADGQWTIGYLGRLEPGKRLDVLLDSLALLRQRLPGIRCLIAGSGSLEAPLRRRAASLGLEGHVRWLGWQDEPWDVLAALDALVLLSDAEGLPLAVLEAMHAGVPVVASRVGGVPELVEDSVSGLLMDTLAPAPVAERLAALAGDAVLGCRLAAEGRRMVAERFTVARLADGVEQVYRRLLAGRPAQASGVTW